MNRRLLAWLLGLSVGLGAGCGERGDPAPAPSAPASPASGSSTEPRGGLPAGEPSVKGRPLRKLDDAPSEPTDPRATSRWYERLLDGQKSGWLHVVWAPSTWEGKPTVRDTTTAVSRSSRRMDRTVDTFETETVSELERGEDGTLWWSRSRTTEGQNRVTTEEVTWKGDGYELVVRLNDQEERRRIDTKTPVFVEAEPFLGSKILAKTLKTGDRYDLPLLNWQARRVDVHTLEVVGPVQGPGPKGPVPATFVRERDPATGTETLLWIDDEGAFAAIKGPGFEIRRVAPEVARERPTKPASYSITLPAEPPLERIYSADTTKVDVRLRGDETRKVPEFPASPWSRVTGVEGDDARGWVVHATLSAYDAPDAKATIPVTDPAFAKDLEPTVLMPCRHPDVVAAAKSALDGETDARRAVARLSNWVFKTLTKESTDVAEPTAVEILEQRQGDCSEHALLFVALCRAAGIPARRCSGYVCVGEQWGAHAWAEVWTGAWMGVDPTTDDVGTAARYLFFGRSEDPENRSGLISTLIRGRMRIVTTEVTEGAETVDLRDAATYRVVDVEKGTASHRLAGLEFRGVPPSWKITLRGNGSASVVADDWSASIQAFADQGTRDLSAFDGSAPRTFAGAPAVVSSGNSRQTQMFVSSRRRLIRFDVRHARGGSAAALEALERVMAPTFAMRPGR